MRAVLRNPDLLILDEATANIDTMTEKILEDILNNLPETNNPCHYRPPAEYHPKRR